MRYGFCKVAAVGFAGFLACSATASFSRTPGGQTADLILQNGVIITMEGPDAIVEAIAIKDGRILVHGTDIEVRNAAGPHTRFINLQKKTVLPGFIDAHGHLSGIAGNMGKAALQPPPIGRVGDIPSLVAALKEQAAAQPEGPIVGFGYDDAMLAEGRHPTRQELDKVASDRPVIAIHQSAHLASLNTKALEVLGMLDNAPDPEGGKIRREADGTTASGVVEERALFAANMLVPPRSRDQSLQDLVSAQDIYAANGVTSAQDGASSPTDYALLSDAAQRGLLKIDVDVLLRNWASWPDKAALLAGDRYSHRLRVAGIKLLLDGSLQGRTGWLAKPYQTMLPGQDPHYHGYGHMTDTQLRIELTEAAKAGWHVFAHVNGDAAVQQYLDAIAAVDAAGGRKLEQPVAIHSQYTRRDQLQQMKQLGVVPSFFASHSFYWGDWHRQAILGPARAEGISPQRSAIDLGLSPTTHNDAPVVTPDMMRLVWSSVTRRTRSGDILGPLERVTPYEALMEITINAAYQMRTQNLKGSLTPGKLADLVVLDANPLTIAPEKIDRIHVLTTVKDGKPIFGTWPTP